VMYGPSHGRDCERQMHALRYIPAALRSPIEKVVGTFWVSYTGESGSRLVSCIMMLAEEKETF
jgi:hypothetical protein